MRAADSSSSAPSDTSVPASSPQPSSRRRRVLVVMAISLASLIVLAAMGILVWASVGVMQAEVDPLDKVRTNPAVAVHETPNSFILSPADGASGLGLVFIPGAKVSPDAYLYKLSGIVVESGITVVVTKPILNLAFFDQRPLTTFTNAAPDVNSWFVGGHSLGGVRACQYAAQPDVSGLVLFGSYCANDLADVDTRVLSLSGSADLLSTPEKIVAAADLLPTSTTFFPIEGANHARFGDYGEQAGDGVASLDTSLVRDVITTEVVGFIRKG
ncbi:MAG: alpha/beta hydrolase [Rhodoglobus sp.]